MKIEIAQVITQIISFLVMLWILSRYAWKPIMAMLDERKQKIEAEFKKIEVEKASAEEVRQEYTLKLAALDKENMALKQEVMAQAREQAAKVLDAARAESKLLLIKAQAELQREVAKAEVLLKKELIDTVLSATGKMLQKNIDPEINEKLFEDINLYVEEKI